MRLGTPILLLAALAGALALVVVLWPARALRDRPTGEEGARLVAAEFLGLRPDALRRSRGPRLDAEQYEFRFDEGPAFRGSVRVDAELMYVRGGIFHRQTHEGERRVSREDAVQRAREFADENFPDFALPKSPTAVSEGVAGPLPTWRVKWEIFVGADPPRLLAVQIDAVRNEVMSFHARREQPGRGGRLLAKVTREQAIRTARAAAAREGWEIKKIEAHLARTWRRRPLGYPIWGVAVTLEERVEGPDRAVTAESWLVDAVTGELLNAETGEPSETHETEAALPPGVSDEQGK